MKSPVNRRFLLELDGYSQKYCWYVMRRNSLRFYEGPCRSIRVVLMLKSGCDNRDLFFALFFAPKQPACWGMVTGNTGNKKACCACKHSESDCTLPDIAATKPNTPSKISSSKGTSYNEMMVGDTSSSSGGNGSKNASNDDNDSRDIATYFAAATLPLKKRRVENSDTTVGTTATIARQQAVWGENATFHSRIPMAVDAGNGAVSLPDGA